MWGEGYGAWVNKNVGVLCFNGTDDHCCTLNLIWTNEITRFTQKYFFVFFLCFVYFRHHAHDPCHIIECINKKDVLHMLQRILLSIGAIGFILVLQGCMNPGNPASVTHVVYPADIQSVQTAVMAYRKDNGVLPIKNSTMTTPIYTKYQIDFKRLDQSYLSKPPSNEFSQGGYFDYILINPETDPKVKVIDLTLLNTVQSIQEKVNQYRSQHGYSPLAGVISAKRYRIDFKELGYSEPPVAISPYSGHALDFIMDDNSKIYINYLPDIYNALKKLKGKSPGPGDLRHLLTDHSPYAPVASLPYTLKNNQIVFLEK